MTAPEGAGAPAADAPLSRELLITLYDHFTWARNRLLDAAAGLTPEQLHAPAIGAYGPLHDTFAHMAASQWMWLERVAGSSPLQVPGGAAFADLTALRAWWDTAHAGTMAYLATATPAELTREIHYTNAEGRQFHRLVWHALLHVAIHQAEHRAQIAAQLSALGVEPPPTDLVRFLPAE